MNPKTTTLKVREMFYSLQGEGSRAGEASVFIRLADCNKNCWFCDTDWSFGRIHSLEHIMERMAKWGIDKPDTWYPGWKPWIIWTGGEPTLQLTSEIVAFFKEQGFRQAIETNGTNVPPDGLDYITCSPKVDPPVLHKAFKNHRVNEFRYPCMANQAPPPIEELPPADYYYISPMFLGEKKKMMTLDQDNLQFCINYIRQFPQWRLSMQQHQIWNIR